MAGSARDGGEARRVLHRLLRRADADPVRARRDEPALDGACRSGDLRGEGTAWRRTTLAAARRRVRRHRRLARSLARHLPRTRAALTACGRRQLSGGIENGLVAEVRTAPRSSA